MGISLSECSCLILVYLSYPPMSRGALFWTTCRSFMLVLKMKLHAGAAQVIIDLIYVLYSLILILKKVMTSVVISLPYRTAGPCPSILHNTLPVHPMIKIALIWNIMKPELRQFLSVLLQEHYSFDFLGVDVGTPTFLFLLDDAARPDVQVLYCDFYQKCKFHLHIWLIQWRWTSEFPMYIYCQVTGTVLSPVAHLLTWVFTSNAFHPS